MEAVELSRALTKFFLLPRKSEYSPSALSESSYFNVCRMGDEETIKKPWLLGCRVGNSEQQEEVDLWPAANWSYP